MKWYILRIIVAVFLFEHIFCEHYTNNLSTNSISTHSCKLDVNFFSEIDSIKSNTKEFSLNPFCLKTTNTSMGNLSQFFLRIMNDLINTHLHIFEVNFKL